MNALFEAAKRGDITALRKALKDPNIDPNVQDERTGFTALHTAIAWNNYYCAFALTENAKTMLNIEDQLGRTPNEIDVLFGGLARKKSVYQLKMIQTKMTRK